MEPEMVSGGLLSERLKKTKTRTLSSAAIMFKCARVCVTACRAPQTKSAAGARSWWWSDKVDRAIRVKKHAWKV